MKKALLIPAKTIGDALILMILANHLKNEGFEVTIMHDNILSLKNWFSDYIIKKYCEDFSEYDHIIFQHDDKKSLYINELREKNKNKKFSVCYFTYKQSKHGPLKEFDIVLDNDRPIAQSLAISCQKFFNLDQSNLKTGIVIPKNLTHKKYKNRIIIHPSSSDKKKCWTKKKFIKLALRLKNLGYNVVISVATTERDNWIELKKFDIEIPVFNTLNDFASYLYESYYLIGNDSFAVHLASLLEIDHIVIAGNKKLLKIWQPGWRRSNLIFPSSWVPNFKPFRLREKHFQNFISVKKVLKIFKEPYSK
jgi:heptosyltransferase III